MTKKILVADDSLIIHKVINLTLASLDYEITQCLKEEDLDSTLEEKKYDLILLDYNLSDSLNGLELAPKVAKAQPDTPILVMLGTFDTIEDQEIKRAGIADTIIKPFESSLFISKCQNLIDGGKPFDVVADISESIEQDLNEDEVVVEDVQDEDEQWVVNAPEVDESSEMNEEESTNNETKNALEEELSGWAIEVPSPIEGDEKSDFNALPPVIEGDELPAPIEDLPEELDASEELPSSENFPTEDDLAFPEPMTGDTPTLTSLDDLADEIDEDEISDDEISFSLDSEELEKEILEDNDSEDEDLWVADDEEVIVEDVGESPFSVADPVEHQVDQVLSTMEAPVASVDREEIINEVIERLKPEMQRMVEELCKEQISQVAWEVIPDLAENLIRRDLSTIKDSVMDSVERDLN